MVKVFFFNPNDSRSNCYLHDKGPVIKNVSITRCARERETTAAAQTFSGDQEEDEGGEGDIRKGQPGNK